MVTECHTEDNHTVTKCHTEDNHTVTECHTEDNHTVTKCHTEDRLGKDRLGKDRLGKDKERECIDYQHIADMYNETCVSFPRLTKLSDSRKKAIRARLNQYTIGDFQKLFIMAEESGFLKGQNDRNWFANFDWLIKDSNMAKVLDGNYSNNRQARGCSEKGNDRDNISAGNHCLKPKEAIEAEVLKIAHSKISDKAFERYHGKIHELIRLCCPFESFTQEQIDYMVHEWGIKPLPKADSFVVPDESNFSFFDTKLQEKELIGEDDEWWRYGPNGWEE